MSYLPIYLEMMGRRCLVIGGGSVAERKIANLLEVGAKVSVISPEVTESVARWAKDHAIEILARRYQPGDLANAEIVFVATDDREVNARVHKEARSLGVWVNAADDPAHCDFILPSLLRRGHLIVAVSTGGTSPALARTIREELELYFTDDYEQLAKLAAEVRDALHARSLTVPFETWRRALSGAVRQLLIRGDLKGAKSLLLKEMGVAS